MSEPIGAVIWAGRPAWSEFVFLWFFAGLAAIRALVAGGLGDPASAAIYAGGALLFIALAVFLRQGIHYCITREGIYTTFGILQPVGREIPLREVSLVEIEQGPLDRFFGIGTVILSLKSQERRERIKGVADPEVVYNKIMALI